MNYLQRLRQKIAPETATPEPTKLTQPGFVGFVSTDPAPFRPISANDETTPGLPLAAAIDEFDSLIDRLTDAGFDGPAMEAARQRMSPATLLQELPTIRRHVETLEHPPNAGGDDDRRTCEQCAQLTSGGRCMAAARGEIAAAQAYYPQLRQLHRCIGYRPTANDPVQRTAADRWPGLSGGN